MSKIYSALAGLCLSLLAVGAQPAQAQTSPTFNHCGTQEANDEQQRELMRQIPGYDPTPRAATTPSSQANRNVAVTYTLPIIVHVISNGENVGSGTNLSFAQVQSQIDVLNEDYNKLNADGNNLAIVPAIFQPVRGDAQVKFVPAYLDPNGKLLAEPGIDRVNRNTKSWNAPPYYQAYIQSTIKPGTYWDPTKYVNVWVLQLDPTLLGYAQFPNNTGGLGGLSPLGGAANTDGVVIQYNAYGRVGTLLSAYNKGRTLTHELGHWLGLRHITGDAACGDDYCNDTPPQAALNGGCVAFPHISNCSGNNGDMSMNYMDYSNDVCLGLFSIDQVSRIQTVMANTPRRSELVSSPALCLNGFVAATVGSNSPACTGSSINLTANGPTGATYAWTGPNGFTSTQQNPTLPATAVAAGTYSVLITVTTGQCPKVFSTTVTVLDAPAIPSLTTSASNLCPGGSAVLSVANFAITGPVLSEDFNGSVPGWTITSTGAANTGWQYRTAPYTYASPTGSTFNLTNYSIDGTRFALANSDAGGSGSSTSTSLTSPSFSTTGFASLQVSFQHYYQGGSSSVAAVEASTDGGASWLLVQAYSSTQGTATAPATATLNLNFFVNNPSVMLRWRYATGQSYSWALDNVKVTGTATPLNYSWTLVSGDGLPAVTTTPSITVTPTRTSVYRFSVNYIGSSCVVSSDITINTLSTPVLVASPAIVCPGATSTLSATNLGTLSNLTYSWSLVSGDGLPAATNTPTIMVAPTKASVYKLTVTYTYPGGSCTSSSNIAVNLLPAPTLTASSATVALGATTTLSATNLAGLANLTYSWTLVSGDGLPAVTNMPTIVVTPTRASVYRLTISAPGGCTTSAIISISLSVDKWTASAFPIPFHSDGVSVQVATPTAGPLRLKMYDALGRKVYDQDVANAEVGLNTMALPGLGSLQAGKYTILVQQGGQEARINVVRDSN
ncbi:MAG: M43 family zinc metalloprotease [Janthinobacterium lividum]